MILIGLGANLTGKAGTPEEMIVAGIKALKDSGCGVTRTSSIWISAPVPVSDQPWYRNAVCQIRTPDSPEKLLLKIKRIETDLGRGSQYIRNAPRPIDLDILAYNDLVVETKAQDGLCVPHPRMHERAFVLYPLQEIAPNWIHPVFEKSVKQMIDSMSPGQEIKRLEHVL